MKKILLFCVSLFLIFGVYGISFAKDNKEKSLPPGLQKKSERGQSLPPGWQKKLIVGTILENDIYKHGKMIATDNRGFVTISIEGKLIKLIKDTREIVEILHGM